MELNIEKAIGFGLQILTESIESTKHRVEKHFKDLVEECVFYINKKGILDSFNVEDLVDFETFYYTNVQHIVQPTKVYTNYISKEYVTNNPHFILSYYQQFEKQ